jgi:thymidine kinase
MSLTVYTGPMFSGKTTKLIEDIVRFSDIHKDNKTLIINHSQDTRDDRNLVSSHNTNYQGLSSKIKVLGASYLSEIDIDEYTMIGIDEANLFPDLVSTISTWLKNDKHIVCSGLDGNFKMEKFGKISDLLHMADKFVKLPSICKMCLEETLRCGGTITPQTTVPAPFTKRLTDCESEIEIGGSDKYMAVCRRHHRD